MPSRPRRNAAVCLALAAATMNVARLTSAQTTTPDAAPSTAELMRQVQALQTQVQALQARQDQMQGPSTREVDDAVARVMADAGDRSKLLSRGAVTAGWDQGHFVLRSADGNFSLIPEVLLQIRNATTVDTSGDRGSQNGFEIRRMKFGLEGNAFTKDLTYFIQFATDQEAFDPGAVQLEQAWIRYKLTDELSFRVGQIVDPAIHEQNVRSRFLLAAERSMMNQLIAGAGEEFVQAATVIWQPERIPLRVEGGYEDGRDSGNTDFQDYPNTNANFGFTGRAEYFVYGNRADYQDFTALGNKEDLLVFGAGADISQAGAEDSFLHSFDVQYENNAGLGWYAAYEANFLHDATGADDDSYNYGILLQASYMLDKKWEVFGRYDWTHLDHDITKGSGEGNSFNEITAGVNYYFYGHNAKFTLDGSYLPDGSPGLTPLDQSSTKGGQFVVRAQFQLML